MRTGSTREGRASRASRSSRRRVRHDILWAKRTITEQLPGFVPWSFAVPFGNYGHDGDTNDRRIAPFMQSLLARHFHAVFMTRPAVYTTPKSTRSRLPRIEVHSDTSTDDLYRWLRDRMPARPVPREPLTKAPEALSPAGGSGPERG